MIPETVSPLKPIILLRSVFTWIHRRTVLLRTISSSKVVYNITPETIFDGTSIFCERAFRVLALWSYNLNEFTIRTKIALFRCRSVAAIADLDIQKAYAHSSLYLFTSYYLRLTVIKARTMNTGFVSCVRIWMLQWAAAQLCDLGM